MGLCFSSSPADEKAKAKSDAIDQQLRKWARNDENVINILLLGKFLSFTLFIYSFA